MSTLLKSALTGLLLSTFALAQQDDTIARLEKQALYHPRPYAPGEVEHFTASGGKRIDYDTPDGKQTAWMIVPANATPSRLWLVFGGNHARALDMAPLHGAFADKSEAWLLIDYPGYGACSGEPDPEGIRRNARQATLTAMSALKLDPRKAADQLRVLGHSLGAAAALLAVEEFHLKSAVLCAPFTSTTEMARERLNLPPSIKLTHVFDNRRGLDELKKNRGKAWILHGKDDDVIPFAMSEKLAKEYKGAVDLSPVPAAGHNDLFSTGAEQLKDAIAKARKVNPARP